MKAEQFLLNFEEVRKLLDTCAEYDAFEKTSKAFGKTSKAFGKTSKTFGKTSKALSEKEIKNSFLKKKKFSSISELIKSHSFHDPAKKAFSFA